MSQFDELPEGWKIVSISDMADVTKLAGFEFTKHFNYQEIGEVRVVRGLNIGDGIFKAENFKFIDRETSINLPRSQLKAGDLLITYVGTPGRVALLPNDGATYHLGPNVGKIVICNEIKDARYLLHFVRSPLGISSIQIISKAVTQSSLSMKQIRSILLPLPPLNEQRRIVEKIEALTARSRKARAVLDQIPALLDQFRQSVLAAAFRGDLTADWRAQNPDVETAEALLERIRKNILEEYDDAVVKAKQLGLKKPKKHGLISTLKEEYEDMNHIVEDWQNLPDEWEAVKLNILFDHGCLFDGPFGSNLKTKDYVDSGIRVIRLENVAPLHFIDDKKTFITAEKYRELEKHTVNPGDLIFASFVSEGVRTCILPKLETLAIAKADCFCLRPDENLINKEYLALILSSPQFFFELKKISHGATRVRINTSQLRDSYIPLASPKEQMEIVARVLNVFSIIGQLQEDYLNNEKKIDQLDRSILAKAFRGELVPQDPNDEPAAVLLDRIRAEREQLGSGKKRAKAKK